MITLRQLEFALAVAKHRHFLRAAEVVKTIAIRPKLRYRRACKSSSIRRYLSVITCTDYPYRAR